MLSQCFFMGGVQKKQQNSPFTQRAAQHVRGLMLLAVG